MDIFLNNAIVNAIASFASFCNEQRYFGDRKLKFVKNIPKSKEEQIGNRFLFQVTK